MHAGTQERRRKFYGWGYEGDEVSPQEIVEFEKAWTRLLGVSDFTAVPFPTEDSINLRPSRVKVPASLQAICTTDKYDRLYHTYGASSVDLAYAVRGEFRNAPDAVAYPRTEEDIVKLFHWCEDDSLAAIPYGGGTSVVGGVNHSPARWLSRHPFDRHEILQQGFGNRPRFAGRAHSDRSARSAP